MTRKKAGFEMLFDIIDKQYSEEVGSIWPGS